MKELLILERELVITLQKQKYRIFSRNNSKELFFSHDPDCQPLLKVYKKVKMTPSLCCAMGKAKFTNRMAMYIIFSAG